MKKSMNWIVIASGLVVGAAAVLLTAFGNPANMGFCIACFVRDIAGGMKLHQAEVVQYIRPEIIGLILGSFIIAVLTKEFKPRAGSSPATRFILGAVVMTGALVFLGCPLRMVIRLGGGDANAFVGLIGFVVGILIGIFFLNKGFNLKRTYTVARTEGYVGPAAAVVLLILVIAVPALFAFSENGPGSKHAPLAMALIIALICGAFAQKSRLCMVGGMRDAFMFRDFHLLSGFAAIFVAVLVGNLILGKFSGFSTYLQPIAHASQLWNLLGMVLVGWGSVLLGGCPLRQLILTGEGNGDSAVTVLGMLVGAAIAHNFALAGAAAAMKDDVYSAGGPGINGKVAVVICIVVLLVISLVNIQKNKGEEK